MNIAALNRAQERWDAMPEPDSEDTEFVEQARIERDTIPARIGDWLFPELVDEDKSLDASVLIAALQSGQRKLIPAELAVVLINCTDPALVFQAACALRDRYHSDTEEDVELRAQQLSDEHFRDSEDERASDVEAFMVGA